MYRIEQNKVSTNKGREKKIGNWKIGRKGNRE
jgi:hypothetical protein